jgi:hypothetical protein
MTVPRFAVLAAARWPPLDQLALALAAEFHPADAPGALAELDRLADELRAAPARSPFEEAEQALRLLSARHGFTATAAPDPRHLMLDEVLSRRRGHPRMLSVLYAVVGGRAGIPLRAACVGGHDVVAPLGAQPPLVVAPTAPEAPLPRCGLRLLCPHESARRLLDELICACLGVGDLAGAVRAARLRLALPLAAPARARLALELRALQARLN